ncbi:hypothetical protein Tco_1377326 [Tanacetum coccineum]
MGELEQHIADLVEENQALEKRLDKQGDRIHKLENVDLSKMIREQTVEFIDSQEIDRKINESVKEVVIFSNACNESFLFVLASRISLRNPSVVMNVRTLMMIRLRGKLRRKVSKILQILRLGLHLHHHLLHTTVRRIRGFWHNRSLRFCSSSSSTTSILIQSSGRSVNRTAAPKETAIFSGDEVGRGHIPSVNLSQRLVEPLTEGQRPSCLDIPSSDLKLCQQNNWLALKRPAFDIVKWFHPNVIHLKFQMEGVPRNFSTDQVDDTILRWQTGLVKSQDDGGIIILMSVLEQLVLDQFLD